VPKRTRKSDPASSASRSQKVTSGMEDYLKAIYRLEDADHLVSMAQLTTELDVRGASVTNMIKRLSDLNLVTYEPYKGVMLTDSGRKIALEIVRHHRLLELYLSESLGMPWYEVHAEAELLEHHLSDELEALMDSALGYPTHDPHGDPIPNAALEIHVDPGVNLTQVEPGVEGVVSRVSDRSREQLEYLGTLGVFPGERVAVLERMPFDGPLRVRIGGQEILIGPAVARQVIVDTMP